MPRALVLVFCMLAAALLPGIAAAQSFPTKAVRIVVTFPPGGPLDVISRNVGEKLSSAWGQPVVVDNRSGGNTVIGAEAVRLAPPDGHTLMMAIDSTLVMNQHLLSKLPYDPVKDFTPITLTSNLNLVIVVPAESPYKTVGELLAAAKASPDKLNMGAGSVSTQLCIELFMAATGTKFTYVPYRGSAPVVQAVLSKEVDAACDGLAGTTPHIRAGKMRALAVTGPKRFAGLPEVPTLAQANVVGMQMVVWTALVGPASMPRPTVEKINADVRRALEAPDIRDRMQALGIETMSSTPEELAALIQTDGDRWGPPIRKAGIKLDGMRHMAASDCRPWPSTARADRRGRAPYAAVPGRSASATPEGESSWRREPGLGCVLQAHPESHRVRPKPAAPGRHSSTHC